MMLGLGRKSPPESRQFAEVQFAPLMLPVGARLDEAPYSPYHRLAIANCQFNNYSNAPTRLHCYLG